ncbi:MAG: type I DNA topoisomerase, partial [Desulfobulbaceae bacterium]|nr:type I DNA topoisomerase [Desulfobulbaceae bacterium]
MSKSLIIVESPTKVKTLKKYLGKSFDVKASVGHIRDLPVKSLGVDVEHDFEPEYVTIRGKGKIISELQNAAKKADRIFLAPDPDREGEAIAYHIAHCLSSAQKPVSRVLFHELTKKAVLAAIDKSSELNLYLFEAQQARRILDRLVGYQISPLLWEKVRRGLSAGRVQSVAVRMVCEREQEIESFVSEEYWTIDTHLKGTLPPSFNARLDRIEGKKKKVEDRTTAEMITAELQQADFVVEKVEKKEKRRHPAPPFITSTLQIDANRKLRFSAKKTMTIAQKLYEGIELGKAGPVGLITYMRTDSTRINGEALSDARTYIKKSFGPDYLPPKPRVFKSKKSAQDAHEAIRPTDVSNTPDSVAPYLDRNMLSLYTLIWKRFVASQMNPALFDQTSIRIDAGKYSLKAVGSIMRFLGFMTLYVEAAEGSSSDPDKKRHSDRDVTLPDLTQGDRLQLLDVLPKQHFTQPLPRYTEATLVKALEENGVGRPSTYAAILSTIQDKEYTILAERKFSPTDLGKLVNEL